MKGKSGQRNQNIPLKTMLVTLSDQHYPKGLFNAAIICTLTGERRPRALMDRSWI